MKEELSMDTIQTIDSYISQFSDEQQKRMQEVRSFIISLCPQAKEKISWGMPTFDYYGNLIHFAQNKNHLGIYPGESGITNFTTKLSAYTCTKGSIHLPNEKPIPFELLREIIVFRIDENKTLYEMKKKH